MNNENYQLELLGIFKSIPDEKKDAFTARFIGQSKNPTAVWGWSAYLGVFGVDRFMIGHVGLGILKLLTFGGLYIWYFVDLFLVAGHARKNNIELARQIVDTI